MPLVKINYYLILVIISDDYSRSSREKACKYICVLFILFYMLITNGADCISMWFQMHGEVQT